METTKAWYASKTIWASILQMAVGVAVGAGLINDVAGTTIIADGPDIVIGLINSALGAYGVYGRVKATKTIV